LRRASRLVRGCAYVITSPTQSPLPRCVMVWLRARPVRKRDPVDFGVLEGRRGRCYQGRSRGRADADGNVAREMPPRYRFVSESRYITVWGNIPSMMCYHTVSYPHIDHHPPFDHLDFLATHSTKMLENIRVDSFSTILSLYEFL